MSTKTIWVIEFQNLYVLTMGKSTANFMDAKYFDNISAARAFAKRHDMRDVKYLEVELKGNVIGDRL